MDALYLGIELGSTRIKACALDGEGRTKAIGSHEWSDEFVDGHWSYSLDAVWNGVQAAYTDLVAQLNGQTAFSALGVSAMMHGYLAFDEQGRQLVPFRTWRDTTTAQAAEKLTKTFGFNIPLRWSVAHLYQAVIDGEEHVSKVAFLTTLAGYVHWKLTGEKVLGVGDASGMFPIDPSTGDYDATMSEQFDELSRIAGVGKIRNLLPRVLPAGREAGKLTEEGARLLDPTGDLKPGSRVCPPEGDAGTGMVATNAVKQRTGNVSVGTSIFAMVVLDTALSKVYPEIDIVMTPDGSPVAMVHCNNGTNELSAWMDLFAQVAVAFGKNRILDMDDVYRLLLTEALSGADDAGGVTAYNFLAGEPVVGLEEARPLILRGPTAELTVANFLRAQVFAVFAALEIGMRTLRAEDVHIDVLYAHGGLFRTPGVGQRLLAGALNTPVGVAATAGEGGAWGIAMLARYLDAQETALEDFLDQNISAENEDHVVKPHPADRKGFEKFLERFNAGLELQPIAVKATKENNDG